MSPRAKKILRNIIFLLSIPAIVCAFYFANNSTRDVLCEGWQINISNPDESFVTEQDIVNIIDSQQIYVQITHVKDIDLNGLKNKILENSWIQNTNVFVSPNGKLHIQIDQRKPVVRIQQKDSSDYAYYLDAEANPITLSQKYTPRLLTVTASRLGYDESDLKLKSSLVEMATWIANNDFWSKAITQIDLLANHQMVLIPAFGDQTILFGHAEDIASKFARLFAFYEQGMKTLHWEKYDEIDVRFAGQIVARNTKGEILAENPYDTKSQLQVKEQSRKAKVQNATHSKDPLQSVSAKVHAKLLTKPSTKKVEKENTKQAVKTIDKKLIKPVTKPIIKKEIKHDADKK